MTAALSGKQIEKVAFCQKSLPTHALEEREPLLQNIVKLPSYETTFFVKPWLTRASNVENPFL